MFKIYFRSKTVIYYFVSTLKWLVLISLIYHIMFFIRILLKVLLVRTSNIFQPQQEPPLILLWNKYHLTGSSVYTTIFARITGGQCKVCQTGCREGAGKVQGRCKEGACVSLSQRRLCAE